MQFCITFLVLLLSACAALCAPASAFSAKDVRALEQLVAGASSDDFGGDMRAARFALSALADVGADTAAYKQSACKLARATLAPAAADSEPKLSTLLHAAVTTARLSCSDVSLNDVTRAKLRVGLASKKLADLYAAVVAHVRLNDAGALGKALPAFHASTKAILALADEATGGFRSSPASSSSPVPFNAGLALEALVLAKAPPSAADASRWLSALLEAGDRDATTGALALSAAAQRSSLSALRATSAVAVAIHALRGAGVKLDIAEADVAGLATYLTESKSVSSLAAAASLTRGLAALSDRTQPFPVAVSVDAFGKNNKLSVRVSDVLDKAVTTKKVTLVKATLPSADSAALENVEAKGKEGAYSFALGDLACGKYQSEIKVVVSDKNAMNVNTNRIFKIACDLEAHQIELNVRKAAAAAGKGAIEQTIKVKAGTPTDETIKLASRQTLQVSFKVRDSSSKASLAIQQAFVRFAHAKSGRDFVVVASQKSGKYNAQLFLNVATIGALGRQSGEWSAELILGDDSGAAAKRVALGGVTLSFKGAAKERYSGGLAKSLPTIDHKFRDDASRPPAVVSYLFTALAVAPLFVLLILLTRIDLQFQLPSGAGKLYSLLFHCVLGAVLALLMLYWWRLNILETLQYLAALAVPLVLVGRQLLASLQKKQK